jgi:chromosome segregation ATPase
MDEKDAGIEPVADAAPVETDPTPAVQEESSAAVIEPATAAARSESFWARPGWLAVALAGLLSSCLAVVLTLAVLSILNRGLLYASPDDVRTLQAQVDTLQTRVDSSAQDIAGLRTRVDQLEELAARTTQLERMALDLQAEIDKRVAQAEELKGAVTDLQNKITSVVTQSDALKTFFENLRDMLNKLPLGGNIP